MGRLSMKVLPQYNNATTAKSTARYAEDFRIDLSKQWAGIARRSVPMVKGIYSVGCLTRLSARLRACGGAA